MCTRSSPSPAWCSIACRRVRTAARRRWTPGRLPERSVKRSVDRILTTHAGSLPRPVDLLDLMRAGDRAASAPRVRSAVAEIVAAQLALGLDVIDDGEMSKPSFVTYVQERLAGFEPSGEPAGFPWAGSREVLAFPEFYDASVRQGANAARLATPLACTGRVSYTGHTAVREDIDNLKA